MEMSQTIGFPEVMGHETFEMMPTYEKDRRDRSALSDVADGEWEVTGNYLLGRHWQFHRPLH